MMLRRHELKAVLRVLLLLSLLLLYRGSDDEHEASAVSLQAAAAPPESKNADALSCHAENKLLIARLERLERIFNVSQLTSNESADDISLLEMFSQQMRAAVFAAVPPTDAECRFNWIIGKCYPLCQCELRPKLGDLTPNRACRLVPEERRDPACDATTEQTPWFQKVARGIGAALHGVHEAAEKVKVTITVNAPPTDSQCHWSWRKLRCAPLLDCTLVFELGDYSLDRMCRLRVDDLEDESEAGNAIGWTRSGNGPEAETDADPDMETDSDSDTRETGNNGRDGVEIEQQEAAAAAKKAAIDAVAAEKAAAAEAAAEEARQAAEAANFAAKDSAREAVDSGAHPTTASARTTAERIQERARERQSRRKAPINLKL